MSFRHKILVFYAAARLGFKEVFTGWLALIGSFLMYATLVVTYAGVFRWIPDGDLLSHHLTRADMVWYLGATEFVLFCCSSFHFKELQNDIQTDHIHLALLRPCAAWVVKIGEWSGQYFGRLLIFMIPGFGLTGLMAGRFDISPIHLVCFVISLPMANLILLCCYFIIGASCLWLKQAEPMFWIWQKSLFLFGALLWPLALYPDLLRRFAWLTPFPAILATPGGWMLSRGVPDWAFEVMHQMFWLALLVTSVSWLNRVLLRRIQDDGE
jgi:ABC-2 type transport system permease protein